MNTHTEKPLTPAEIREQAEAWYARQLRILAKAHGTSWAAHREWIESYLKEEIRERLVALGWRSKR